VSLSPVVVEQFAGLRLDLDPEEVGLGAAIDVLNVDLSRPGRARTRNGYTRFDTDGLAAASASLAPIGRSQLAVGAGTWVYNYPSSGTAAASINVTNGPGTEAWSFTVFGTPSTTRTYGADGTDTLVRLQSGSWSQPTCTVDGVVGQAMPKAQSLAVQSPDNRLVAAGSQSTTGGPGGAASGNDHVWFSDPGDPESWTSTSYVQITPGDGARITATVTWRDQVFVFKQDKFAVFYGNTVDSAGQPIFNYRTFYGQGCPYVSGVCVAPEGVYFANPQGVWLTNGGQATQIAGSILPLFLGTQTQFYTGPAISFNSRTSLAWNEGLVYVATMDGVGMLVLETATGKWWVYDLPVAQMTVWYPSISAVPEIWFTDKVHGNLYHFTRQAATDNGAAITSRYRSGFDALGGNGREKTVRQTELAGTGTLSFGWSRDFGTVSSSSVTMGASPAVSRAWHRSAQRGEVLSWQASSTSGQWALNRVVPFVRPVRDAGDATDG
jgi:hypothetical protein